jgi:hypothetical protein
MGVQPGGYCSPWVGQIDEARVSDTARSAAWIEFEYENMANPSLTENIGPATSGEQTITISNSFVGGDLTDFPLLVKIFNDTNLTGDTQNGNDIYFTLPNGNRLASEKEDFSISAEGASGDFWVKVPEIYTGATIVMHIGGEAAPSTGPETATLTIPSLSAGTHTITAVYSGDTKYASVTAGTSVMVTNVPPIVSAGGPYIVNEGQTATLHGAASDPGNDIVSYQWDLGHGYQPLGLDPVVSVADIGTSTIHFRAVDACGDASDPASASITINHAPNCSGIANISTSQNSPDSSIDLWSAFSDDIDGASQLTYQVLTNDNPALVRTTVDSVSGTLIVSYVPSAHGHADLVVRATDSGGLTCDGCFSVDVVSDAVGHWTLDEGNGTIAHDSAGGNDGTLKPPTSPPTWTQGRDGGALHFDGIDDYVDLGTGGNLTFSGSITLAAWIRPEDITTTGSQIIVGRPSGTGIGTVELCIINGHYRIGVAQHYTQFDVPAGDVDHWVQLVGTYDGTTWRLYRNGVLLSSNTETSPVNFAIAGNAHWGIGALVSGSQFFSGTIDDVRVYDDALSPSEVAILYSGTGNGPPVIHDQSFLLPDGSPNGMVFGTVVATDPNPCDTLSFDVTAGNDDSVFELGAGGELRLSDGSKLDFVHHGNYQLTVRVTDSGDPLLSSTATITVSSGVQGLDGHWALDVLSGGITPDSSEATPPNPGAVHGAMVLTMWISDTRTI